MIRYVFSDERPPIIKCAAQADPQVLGETVAAIRCGARGLTSGAVVDAARDPRSPLHRHFEWDDSLAGEAYRREQARGIIRIIRRQDSAEEEPRRAWISIGDPAVGGVAYRPVDEVKASPQLQHLVLRQADRDLEAFERRYRDLTDICGLVRTARDRLSRRLTPEEAPA